MRTRIAKKILLPTLELTELASSKNPAATAVIVPSFCDDASDIYFVKPKVISVNRQQRDGSSYLQNQQFNLFPVVFDSCGVPWAEAMLYILSRLEDKVNPEMTTYAGIADDLATFRWFLDEFNIDWTNVPAQKSERPTYRFNGHLKHAVAAGEVAAATARRRMGTAIGFYRWVVAEGVLIPKYPLWKESDRFIDFRDSRGNVRTKTVITTDISIKVPKQDNPYDEKIEDGGKLRPLPIFEQKWVKDALASAGNIEMTLIHLIGLLTGARIQTILTIRVRHITSQSLKTEDGEVRLPVGSGTGIDTKGDKKMTIHFPSWFFEKLRIYARSERAMNRRKRAPGGDTEDQYLFLSVRGNPLYKSKADCKEFDKTKKSRYVPKGHAVRTFISERIIPFVREKYEVPTFHFQFHDTRATAGMNLTDHLLKRVEQGDMTLHQAREYVKTWMGHESASTTDLYLQYRHTLKIVRWAEEQYEGHLKDLCQQALDGVV